MRARLPVLTLALCLTAALFACQDDPGAMGPEILSPLFGVDCDRKPDHPQCVDTPPDAEVASVLFTSGFNPVVSEHGIEWTEMDWENGNTPGSILDLSSDNPFETDLAQTELQIAGVPAPSNGTYGDCIYEPADTDPDLIVALAGELDGVYVPPDAPEQENIQNTRINVDLGALPTSIDNFVRFLYLSYDPDLMSVDKRGKYKGVPQPGSIGFQVGGYWNVSGYPDVSVEVNEVTGVQTFTFTGGTVSVAKRGGTEPRLQCPLLDDVIIEIDMTPNGS